MKKINLNILLFSLLALLAASCKSPQNILTNDSAVSHKEHKSKEKDSVYMYIKDSVFVFIKGDTILKEHFRTEYRDRFQGRTDTLKIKDTVQIRQTQYINAETSFNGWQWFQIWCGRILLLIFGLWFIVKGIKTYIKR